MDASSVNEIQKSILAPYRTLRDVTNLTFIGVSQTLANAVISEIKSAAPTPDPRTVHTRIETIKEEGKGAYSRGDCRKAIVVWRKALDELHSAMVGTPGARTRKKGGVLFVNSLIGLEFTILSNVVSAQLESVKRAKAEGFMYPHMLMLVNALWHTLDEAKTVLSRWPDGHDATWEPTPTQMAKLLYREAKACRIIGDTTLLTHAELAIKDAIERLPGDNMLLQEQEAVDNWRAKENRHTAA